MGGDAEEKDLSESEDEESDEEEADEDEKESEKETNNGTSKKVVTIKEAKKDTHKNSKADKVAAEDRRLAIKQMGKKTKKLHGKIMYGQRRMQRQAQELRN